MDRVHLSIIIPAFNEAERIGDALAQSSRYATETGRTCEVVVFDDGSTDETAEIVRAFEPGPLTIRLLGDTVNHGKGHAVQAGMLAATGDYLLMCDADMSTPIEEVERLLAALEGGWDIAIGSRDMPDSRLDPPQPLPRRLMAWTFRAIRRRLMLPGLRDTQCGFKLFKRDVARMLFERQTVAGWLFDCEVLGLAERMGYRVREVGVTWRHHPHTRVRPLREALGTLRGLLRIRRRLSGRHGNPRGPSRTGGESACD